jgi:hypothetical protein
MSMFETDHVDAEAAACRAKGAAGEPFGGVFAEPPLSSEKRERLRGGIFSPPAALKLLNSHYLIGKSEQDSGIFRIRDDGSLALSHCLTCLTYLQTNKRMQNRQTTKVRRA